MNRKKSLFGFSLLSLTLFFSHSIVANAPYVGIGIGHETADFKQRATLSRPSTAFKEKIHFAGRGAFGSIFAGYAGDCDYLYLAGELNANLSAVKFKASNDEYIHQNFTKTTYKMNRDFGISILPGYLFADCNVLYARLGYVNGKFKINSTDVSIANISKNLCGLRYGLGIKQALSEYFSLRLDYSRSNFKKAKLSSIDGLGTRRGHIFPQTDKFELGAVFNF